MSNEAEAPKPIWHYTKIGVLEKMLTSDGVNIRFTNSKYSKNDPSESLVLQDLLLKNEKDIKEKYSCHESFFDFFIKKNGNLSYNNYIFSMSRLENSFAFWSKEYAGTDGIAIGFDEKKFKDLIDNVWVGGIFGGVFGNVNYDESIEDVYKIVDSEYEKYENMFISVSNDFSKLFTPKSASLGVFLDCHSSIFKCMSWKHEQEVRAILIEFNIVQQKTEAKIEFVENKITKNVYQKFDKDIVKSIMLGPACGDEHIELVKEFLTENGYDKIDVSRSKAFYLRYNG